MRGHFWKRVGSALVTNPRGVLNHPTIRTQNLDAELVRTAAKAQRLTELGPREVRDVEPDHLFDRDHLFHLLRTSLHRGTQLWMLTLPDLDARARLEERFPGLVHDLSTVTPLAVGLRPADMARQLIDTDPDAAHGFEGMDMMRVPRDIIVRLRDRGVPIQDRYGITRLMRNPRFIVYLIVFTYSALRALPVMFVKEFHGNLWILWTIDVLTAIPYTWGILAMVLAKRRRVRALGAVVAIATFMAPYIYFGSHGRHYPTYVWFVVGFLVTAAVAIEAWKFTLEKTLTAQYASVAPSPDPIANR